MSRPDADRVLSLVQSKRSEDEVLELVSLRFVGTTDFWMARLGVVGEPNQTYIIAEGIGDNVNVVSSYMRPNITVRSNREGKNANDYLAIRRERELSLKNRAEQKARTRVEFEHLVDWIFEARDD